VARARDRTKKGLAVYVRIDRKRRQAPGPSSCWRDGYETDEELLNLFENSLYAQQHRSISRKEYDRPMTPRKGKEGALMSLFFKKQAPW